MNTENTRPILKGAGNRLIKLIPAIILLAGLTACGSAGGSAGGSESLAIRDVHSPNMVQPQNLVTRTGYIPVVTNTSSKGIPAPAPMGSFSCAHGAVTCVEVASTSSAVQTSVPVTFGQPFRAGDWKHNETGLIARDNFNTSIPIQADEVSSHRDGSARFAVFNLQMPTLQAGERRIVSLFKGSPATAPKALQASPNWKLSLEAKIYTQQVTKVTFGDARGHTAGTPFLAGQTITMHINGSANESFTHTITADQAGGGFATLTKIAQAFQALINAKSSAYVVEKLGSGGGYQALWIKTKNPSGKGFTVSFSYGGLAKISQQNLSNYQAPAVWTATAQTQLEQQVSLANNSQASASRRWHGPVSSEFHLVTPFANNTTGEAHAFLTARFDVRLFDGSQRVRTDAVIENNWAFKPNPKNITYELAFKVNGQSVHNQAVFTHFAHARWHKAVWSGTAPETRVRHHMPYFMASRAVHNYDLSLAVPETTLASEASSLAQKRTQQAALGPMANTLLQPMFGTTGGRPDIGPLPKWTALYLVTQDDRMREAMMAVADSAAAVPVHFRNENTGHPVDTIANPTLSVHYNGPNIPLSGDPTIWAPDTAHQASFAYVPYLLTGDRFYLDEAMFWASWNVFTLPAGYRGDEKSLIHRHQVRGTAWALRSIGEAYRMLPDAHAMKSTFRTILDNNLDWYHQYYVVNGAGSPMGAIQHSPQSTPPWQNDFVATSFGLLAENSDPFSKEVLAWFSKFNVGRLMSDADGFCAAKAPGYYWTNIDSQGGFINSWSQLFATNYPADVGKSCDSLSITEGYPSIANGYAAYARAMLGASANASMENAVQAYQKWKAMTPAMETALPKDPTWAIVPR